ncbi:hypothetical protein CK1_18980 [Ruminococcus sp. SR1/5]|nr:hypothetical protein CK1_18980 [Ruminococcus sp. SR1/5]
MADIKHFLHHFLAEICRVAVIDRMIRT